MNPESTLTQPPNCPKNGDHLSLRISAGIAPSATPAFVRSDAETQILTLTPAVKSTNHVSPNRFKSSKSSESANTR